MESSRFLVCYIYIPSSLCLGGWFGLLFVSHLEEMDGQLILSLGSRVPGHGKI